MPQTAEWEQHCSRSAFCRSTNAMCDTRKTSIGLVLGVRSGQTRLALDTLASLEQERAGEYHAVMRHLGLTTAIWQFAVSPQGTLLILHLQGSDVDDSLYRLGNAAGNFERWLIHQLSAITGQTLSAERLQQLAQPLMARFSASEIDDQKAIRRGHDTG